MLTQRFSLGVLLTALCLLALRGAPLAQSPATQSPAPTFRSSVDLLTIDTSVRDKSGLPLPDLQASDFTVTIDGKPRKVVSSVFFNTDVSAGGRVSGGAAPAPQYVSNTVAPPGRVVVFALDSSTIRGGQERSLFETASRMLDGLSPSDAVGLVEWPGPAIDVTRNHRAVADALQRFWGRKPGELENLAGGGNISPDQPRAIALPKIAAAAHGQQVLLDLAKLVRDLAVVRAPRSVIFISGGFDFDSSLIAQYKELQHAAAESRVTLYTVLLEEIGYESSLHGEARPDAAQNPAATEGLATIGSMTGGMSFNAAGRAVGIFDRIQSEVSSFYQLAIESSPADADGKERDVKVRVSRAGVDVRAPSHIAVAKPAKAAPRDPLILALQQPTDIPDVPIAVTTYTTHGSANAVQVLVSAEVGAATGAAPAEWGFEVRQNGKGVVNTRGRITAGSERPRLVATTVSVPPGEYRLRVAAVDAEFRVGVIEIPFTARLQAASGTTLSDLLVGVATAGELEARHRLTRTETLTAMLEVRTAAGDMPGGTLQLIPGGSARSVLNIPLAPRPATTPGGPAILQGRAPLEAVPPGRYTASAAVQVAGQALTRVDRVLEITGPPLVTPVAIAPPAAVPAPVAEATPAPPPPASPVTAGVGAADDVVRRAGAYVDQYGGKASLLVALEHYSQSVTRTGVPAAGERTVMRGMAGNAPVDAPDIGPASVTERRRLVSEFALAPSASTAGGWLGYRDVLEVDGKPVPGGHERLQAIFRSDVPDVVEARRIASESARYNIGPVSRNFNIPTTSLFFFHAANLSRFTFRSRGRERIDGLETVVVDFREARVPTLIMTSAGKDVPASGTLWVSPADGAIVRTRLELEKFDDAGSKAVIEVQYQKDKKLAMWVPARMTERYSGTAFAGAAKSTATTVATYTDFKRFETSVKIK